MKFNVTFWTSWRYFRDISFYLYVYTSSNNYYRH